MGFYSGICILTVLMAFFIFQSDAQEKNYTVPEELPENVLIGDLVKDLNLTFSPDKKLSTPLQFKLVYKSGDLPIVKIEETTGEIYTTGVRIDREELCTGIYIETHCFYEVEVAVLPDEIFKLVKIRFIIEDVNDNAPLFPATVINISIPENTAINSRYPIPSAIDPDIGINGIQQYELIKVPYGALGPIGVPAHEPKVINADGDEISTEGCSEEENCDVTEAVEFPENLDSSEGDDWKKSLSEGRQIIMEGGLYPND